MTTTGGADRPCPHCATAAAGVRAFRQRTAEGPVLNCWRCALRHRPMLRRSLYTALVVGTVLVLINQGPALFDGRFPSALAWKIPLTYCVPFLVATWGALGNAYLRLMPVRSAGRA